jgi:hypothetical protein
MSCVIPDGAKVKLINGKIVWQGKEYNQIDCTIGEGVTFTTEVKEIDLDVEEQPKPKKKKPAPKTEQKSVEQTSDNIEIDNNANQDTIKDIDMGLPIQAPQDANPGQGQPIQQMPIAPQMQPIAPQSQMMPVQQMQQGFPQGFTVPPQYQQQFQQFQQQFQPQQMTNEVQHPQEGLNINMIKQIMDLAQGNVVVMAVLIAGYLGFTWMKKMEKIKEKEAENGGAHASACDNDRKHLSTKLSDIDFKVQKVEILENKVKQMGDVNGRLTKLEENSNGLTFNDTSELEETLAKVTKKIESLDKKIQALASAKETTLSKEPVKKSKTQAVQPLLPPEDDDE